MPCANRSRSILNLVFPSCLTVHPCEGVINQMASKEHGDAAKYTEALAVVSGSLSALCNGLCLCCLAMARWHACMYEHCTCIAAGWSLASRDQTVPGRGKPSSGRASSHVRVCGRPRANLHAHTQGRLACVRENTGEGCPRKCLLIVVHRCLSRVEASAR